MKNLDKKKLIILGIIIFILIFSLLLFFLLSRESEELYDGDPIPLEVLPLNNAVSIDVRNLRIDEDTYAIWGISNKTSLTAIEDMIRDLGLNLTLESEKEGSYYYWADAQGNNFQYFLLRNSLIFNVVDGISWDEVTLTGNSFSAFVMKYFDASWDYELTGTLNLPEGRNLFYAQRLTPDGIGIERTPNLYQETDYLILQGGMIRSGEIFLTHFFDTEISLPLLRSNELVEYVNNPDYPKVINVRPDQIATALGLDEEYSYMDMEIIELQQSVDNCKAINYSVVYLYESFNQSLLVPTYRLGMECTLVYEESEYSVPAIAYVNAVHPRHITVLE